MRLKDLVLGTFVFFISAFLGATNFSYGAATSGILTTQLATPTAMTLLTTTTQNEDFMLLNLPDGGFGVLNKFDLGFTFRLEPAKLFGGTGTLYGVHGSDLLGLGYTFVTLRHTLSFGGGVSLDLSYLWGKSHLGTDTSYSVYESFTRFGLGALVDYSFNYPNQIHVGFDFNYYPGTFFSYQNFDTGRGSAIFSNITQFPALPPAQGKAAFGYELSFYVSFTVSGAWGGRTQEGIDSFDIGEWQLNRGQ